MLNFTRLQLKAEKLYQRVTTTSSTSSFWPNFFACACLPAIRPDSKIYQDANLITLTARILKSYEAEDDLKLKVLIGMYCYVYNTYEGFQKVINMNFLTILSEHLDGMSPETLSVKLRKDSAEALEVFCTWVIQNQSYVETMDLYRAFPPNMRDQIRNMSRELTSSDFSDIFDANF